MSNRIAAYSFGFRRVSLLDLGGGPPRAAPPSVECSGLDRFQAAIGAEWSAFAGAARRPAFTEQLARALPQDRFDHAWQRERVLARAATFERDARRLAAGAADPCSSLGGLRSRLVASGDLDAKAPITLVGVASHFGPETLQAHLRDTQGRLRVFVRDGAGAWVEREDLAAKAGRGEIPSSDPGRRRDARGTATFGRAEVSADGRCRFEVPDVSKLDHAPRARPFAVGDEVDVRTPTGQPAQRTEGSPYVAEWRADAGRIVGTDGRGKWTVELIDANGAARAGADGKPMRVEVSDQQLRASNSPHLFRSGDSLWDSTMDPGSPENRRLVAEWRASPEHRALAPRPGPQATERERAAWEADVLHAADRWLNQRMTYPRERPSSEQIGAWRAEVAEIDADLAALRQGGATKRTLPPDVAERVAGFEETISRSEQAIELAERTGLDPSSARSDITRARRDRDTLIGSTLQRERAEIEARLRGAETLRDESAETYERAALAREAADLAARAGLPGEAVPDLGPAVQRSRTDRLEQRISDGGEPLAIGEYAGGGLGQCRHQAIALASLLQDAGVDARLTRGPANTQTGDYRGEHIWLEVTLSDGRRLMADPTWTPSHPIGDLRTIYGSSPTRIEAPEQTEGDDLARMAI